jgi:hypothetical protein
MRRVQNKSLIIITDFSYSIGLLHLMLVNKSTEKLMFLTCRRDTYYCKIFFVSSLGLQAHAKILI